MPKSPTLTFRPLIFLGLLLALESTRVLAAELIFPGTQPKLTAGAGQTVSRGASSLYYNPANLITSKFLEPAIDVSMAQVKYQYQHVDDAKYDPVQVSVVAPPVTAGLSLRPVPSLALGLSILPTGTGAEQKVASVPLALSEGSYDVCDIVTKQSGMKIAAGAAFRFDFPFTLGFGLIHETEKHSLLIYNEGESDAFVDALYSGTSSQFVGGVRSEIFERKVVVGLSYKTAVTKSYKGDILIAVDPNADYTDYEGKVYVPAAIGLGTEGRIGNFGAFFDVVMEQWSAGRKVAKRGLGQDPAEVDYINTMNLVIGGKAWIGSGHMLEAGYGIYPPNVGNGDEEAATTTLTATSDRVGGVQFGSLEALARDVFAFGYRYQIAGTGHFDAGANYQMGKRVVPEGFNQAGTYSLTALVVTLGGAYGF